MSRRRSKQPNREVANTRNWHRPGCARSGAENRSECARRDRGDLRQFDVVVVKLPAQSESESAER